ncbi:Uu.00g110850.m01.CDS01 [Anthostomella pinea]|uniref:Uu.00g110850.m01.CDS01 n=1 Tax=Anthostomella pinea TaxID=933095 RepID=A0AAI8YGF8_9PEZI|nr:Uu.00g110850.m01.CDS01 [Anthostomella pinea]
MSTMLYTRNRDFLAVTLYAHLGLLLAFTPPNPSTRLLATIALVAHGICAYVHAAPPDEVTYVSNALMIGINVVIYGSHFLYLTLRSPPPSAVTLRQKANWCVKLLSSPRDPRHQPPFSRRDPAYVPSRGRFVVSQLLKILFCAVLEELFDSLNERFDASLLPGDYSPAKTVFVRRVLLGAPWQWREVWIRAWFPLVFVIPQYAFKTTEYCYFSLIAIFVFGDDHRDWRPLFGDLRDTYTLRRFWGNFEPQYIRQAYVSHAKAFTNLVLGIRSARLKRMTITALVFSMTTAVYALISFKEGGSVTSMVRQWARIVAGIVFEDTVQMCFRWAMPTSARGATPWWARLVGYVWVYFFFSWSLAKVWFPVDERLH